jgi:hypothetical protein
VAISSSENNTIVAHKHAPNPVNGIDNTLTSHTVLVGSSKEALKPGSHGNPRTRLGVERPLLAKLSPLECLVLEYAVGVARSFYAGRHYAVSSGRDSVVDPKDKYLKAVGFGVVDLGVMRVHACCGDLAQYYFQVAFSYYVLGSCSLRLGGVSAWLRLLCALPLRGEACC